MQEYKTTGIVRVNCGYIGLDKKQADVRRSMVKPVKGKSGIYEILAPIELKNGEVVRMEKPDKVLLKNLAPAQPEKLPQADTVKKEDIVQPVTKTRHR